MLVQASTYFFTPSRLVTIGINLQTYDVDVELRCIKKEFGVPVANWEEFVSKFQDIEEFFSQASDVELSFSSIDIESRYSSSVVGRTTKKLKRVLDISSKYLVYPVKLTLSEQSFIALKKIEKLVSHQHHTLQGQVKHVLSIARTMSFVVITRRIPLKYMDTYLKGLFALDFDQIILEYKFDQREIIIMHELLRLPSVMYTMIYRAYKGIPLLDGTILGLGWGKKEHCVKLTNQ
jgi:hypothetical protein